MAGLRLAEVGIQNKQLAQCMSKPAHALKWPILGTWYMQAKPSQRKRRSINRPIHGIILLMLLLLLASFRLLLLLP